MIGVAILECVVAEIRALAFEQQVDNQPAFGEPEIVVARAHGLAHRRVGAVATHRIARHAARRSTRAGIGDIQRHPVWRLFDCRNRLAAVQGCVWGGVQRLTQQLLEVGLVESVACVPPLRSGLLRSRPVEQQCAGIVDKAHARVDPHALAECAADAERLKQSHALVVEVHGTRQRVERLAAFEHRNLHAAQGKQVREGGPCWSAADDRDIALGIAHRRCSRS